MKNLSVICFLLLLFSCNQVNRSAPNIINIHPQIFPEVEISLNEISDDINYIPLDNQFPIGNIYSYKMINDFIYAAIKDVGIVRFTNTGKLDRKYGKIGRGPGEYVYCLHFAVDEKSGTVYVMDHKMGDVEVYNKDGNHVRNIKLPEDEDGFGLSDIEFFNSTLILAQYLNMGRGDHDWIVLDTLENRITEKKNPYPEFKGRRGGNGGLFKYENNIGYWDLFKDTVFSISPDLSYNALCVFTPGEFRQPMKTEDYNPVDVYRKNMGKYIQSYRFFDFGSYYLYEYYLNKKFRLALINKNNGKAKSIDLKNREGGITNNIDGGLPFLPELYFVNGEAGYLVSLIQPFKLKTHLASDEFKNATPKYPEKKKQLEKLANSLSENDNPVLMLVKLK